MSTIRATSEDQEHPATELASISNGGEDAGEGGWISTKPKLPVKVEAVLSTPGFVSSVEVEWMFGGPKDFQLVFSTVAEPHEHTAVSEFQHERPHKCSEHHQLLSLTSVRDCADEVIGVPSEWSNKRVRSVMLVIRSGLDGADPGGSRHLGIHKLTLNGHTPETSTSDCATSRWNCLGQCMQGGSVQHGVSATQILARREQVNGTCQVNCPHC